MSKPAMAKEPLRVAMLAPIAWRTPPRHYGPWERVTSLLTEGLVARGVHVTLFATADSVTTASLNAVAPHGYAEDPSMDGRVWEAMHVSNVLAQSGHFDLVHNQMDWLPLAFAAHCVAPMLTTIHGFSGPGIMPAYLSARSQYAAISLADRSADLQYAAVIHHGIDFAELPAGAGGDYLVVFGRIHPDKGTADAIVIARASGRRLVICGIVQDTQYFVDQIEPYIDDGKVDYLGSVGPEERAKVLGSAVALLHPIAFDEPFGLSVVEAMACGTPVVAYGRGSMPEVVDEGVTGFLVKDVGGAVVAVERAAGLDRRRVRAAAAARFGVDRMVDEYLSLYREIVGKLSSGSDGMTKTVTVE